MATILDMTRSTATVSAAPARLPVSPPVRAKSRPTRGPSEAIQRILAAAREEFGANGFDGTRIEQIARRAGVSKQLVYFYFVGKQELYGEIVKQIARESYERILRMDFETLDPDAAIRAYIQLVFDEYQSNPVMAAVHMDQSLRNGAQILVSPDIRLMQEEFRTRLGGVLARAREAGVVRSQMAFDDLEFMVVTIVTGCLTSRGMFARFSGRKPIDNEGSQFWRDHAMTFILRALHG